MTTPDDPAAVSDERRRFILRRGVFGWGLITAILWSVAMAWWGPGPLWIYLAVALVLFSIGGWFWGAVMWRLAQRHQSALPTSHSG